MCLTERVPSERVFFQPWDLVQQFNKALCEDVTTILRHRRESKQSVVAAEGLLGTQKDPRFL